MMLDKKDKILQSAMNLFAEKGFHNTSMQEIAELSGVAKGSLYTYFQSKEDLLLSIFKKYYEHFKAGIETIEKQTELSEQEKFFQQELFQLLEISQHKDLILINMKEQLFPINSALYELLERMQIERTNWYREKIIAVYGEKVQPHALDLAIMFQSIIKDFFIAVLFKYSHVAIEDVCKFAFNRLEDIVNGQLLTEGPLFQDASQMDVETADNDDRRKNIWEVLTDFKKEIEMSHLSEFKKKGLIGTLDALENELKNPDSFQAVTESLLFYLKHEAGNQFDSYINQIHSFFE